MTNEIDNAKDAIYHNPVAWQFYQDGEWHMGDDKIKDHRKNTEAAGFPIRELYASEVIHPNKYRKEQIEKLGDIISYVFSDNHRAEAEYFYDKGVRVLAPDESPAKWLTEEKINSIALAYRTFDKQGFVTDDAKWIALAVENAILGGIKK